MAERTDSKATVSELERDRVWYVLPYLGNYIRRGQDNHLQRDEL